MVAARAEGAITSAFSRANDAPRCPEPSGCALSTIYAKAAEEFARDFSLTGGNVRPSPLSGTRRVVNCIFSNANRNSDFTEKSFVRVDVPEEFPFLVTPYYER